VFSSSIQKATELGVYAVQPLITQRTENRPAGVALTGRERAPQTLAAGAGTGAGGSGVSEQTLAKLAHWQNVAVAACQQSGRSVLPMILPPLPIGVWLAQAAATARPSPVALAALGAISYPGLGGGASAANASRGSTKRGGVRSAAGAAGVTDSPVAAAVSTPILDALGAPRRRVLNLLLDTTDATEDADGTSSARSGSGLRALEGMRGVVRHHHALFFADDAGDSLPLSSRQHFTQRLLRPAAELPIVQLLVGPEGGFAPAEVALAHRAGFRSVSLGPRILRYETAALAALAALQSHVGDL
jgi:16S rRNA U1498 N3-methylase RsmE